MVPRGGFAAVQDDIARKATLIRDHRLSPPVLITSPESGTHFSFTEAGCLGETRRVYCLLPDLAMETDCVLGGWQ